MPCCCYLIRLQGRSMHVDVQSRYIERAPGCAEPPPMPFQHKKGARKSAPKPGSIEEAREQANQSRKLSRVCHYCMLGSYPARGDATVVVSVHCERAKDLLAWCLVTLLTAHSQWSPIPTVSLQFTLILTLTLTLTFALASRTCTYTHTQRACLR